MCCPLSILTEKSPNSSLFSNPFCEKGNFGPTYAKPDIPRKERDEETGLYYYGARYLDPKTSRWISADPAMGEYIPSAPVNDEARKRNENLPGMGGVFNYVNMHVYHYAGNNPVKYTDPNGEFAFLALLVGGILSVAASAGIQIWDQIDIDIEGTSFFEILSEVFVEVSAQLIENGLEMLLNIDLITLAVAFGTGIFTGFLSQVCANIGVNMMGGFIIGVFSKVVDKFFHNDSPSLMDVFNEGIKYSIFPPLFDAFGKFSGVLI
jgi:RHS repeat-associated protein